MSIVFRPNKKMSEAAKAALGKVTIKDTSLDIFVLSKAIAHGTPIDADLLKRGKAWWEKHADVALAADGTSAALARDLMGGVHAPDWFNNTGIQLAKKERQASMDSKKGILQFKDTVDYVQSRKWIEDVDELEGTITGYGASKHNIDSANEIIDDGAFEETIVEWGPQNGGRNRIKYLFQHTPDKIIGIPTELKEDEIGLYHVSKIIKTSLGSDVLLLMVNEVLTEQSIGYSVLGWEIEDEDDWNSPLHLTKIKLYEISAVVWGANMETPITGIKSNLLSLTSMSKLKTETDPKKIYSGMKELIDNTERALKRGTWQTEDLPSMMELFVKLIKPAVNTLGEALESGQYLKDDVSSLETTSKDIDSEPNEEPAPNDAPGESEEEEPAELSAAFKSKLSEIFNEAEEEEKQSRAELNPKPVKELGIDRVSAKVKESLKEYTLDF